MAKQFTTTITNESLNKSDEKKIPGDKWKRKHIIQNLWDAVKSFIKRQFITIKIYLKKSEKSQINNLPIYLLGISSHSNQTRKRNTRNPNWEKKKKKSKTVTVYRWHNTIIEHPKGNTKKLLELINEFVGHTINMQKFTVFLYNKNKLSQGNLNKSTPPIIASKRKKNIYE